MVNEETMQTADEMIRGGDIVRGGATVIPGKGDGRRAAKAMHRYLQGEG